MPGPTERSSALQLSSISNDRPTLAAPADKGICMSMDAWYGYQKEKTEETIKELGLDDPR